MSVVIRLKVPIEMHYTVIPMGTSKVNSSRSFYRPSVLCDRAFVCHVDHTAGCTAVSPSTGAGAVRKMYTINMYDNTCSHNYNNHRYT